MQIGIRRVKLATGDRRLAVGDFFKHLSAQWSNRLTWIVLQQVMAFAQAIRRASSLIAQCPWR
jgi:hypothetical protein